MAWIEVNAFSYTYPGGTAPALNKINLALEQGAFVVFTGRSGSGKSTLGKALAGFLFSDESPNCSGDIIINGTDMSSIPLYEASKRVAYVQQNPEDQFCTLNVEDEIAFGLENLSVNPIIIEQGIDSALSTVMGKHLKDRELSTLSGGEKQKIAIASMLALKPDVLILDEPTSNLDPQATRNIFETLHNLLKLRKMTVIVIEHKLDQIMDLDPIIFSLDKGKITAGLAPTRKPNHISLPIINSEPSSVLEAEIPSQPIIQMKNTCIEIGGQEILHDLDLSIIPGQFIAIMGPNGSGKSTLLQAIMGFHQVSYGEFMLLDRNANSVKTSDLVEDLGFVFQNPDHQLFTQSIWEELTLTVKNLGQLDENTEHAARHWLEQIDLADQGKNHPQRLSFGEKKRLNVAASLLHKPKLLLIDELLIGQDPQNALAWMVFLKSLSELGTTVLLSIHHPQLVLDYCSRMIFLESGRIAVDEDIPSAFDSLVELGYHSYLPTGKWESYHV